MTNNPNVSLDDLAVFLAVLSAGGFRSAAKRLGRSPSNVSETVARLEVQLGTPLLVRTTRSVSPTDAGHELAATLAPILAEARAALDNVVGAQREVRGRLRLSVPGAVTVDILPPLLDRFLAAHPAVSLEVVVDDRFVDLAEAGCDAGIRYREDLGQDMVSVPIGPRIQELALAAAPCYLTRHGVPSAPGDLMGHDCIRLRFKSGAMVAWDLERNGESITVDPPGRIVVGVDAVGMAIDLARDGQGVIATFRNWLEPAMKRGELVPVLPEWWQGFDGPRLYFRRRSVSAPLRAFLDFVAQEHP